MRTAKALLLTFCLANVFFSASNLGSVSTSSYKTIEKKKIHVDYTFCAIFGNVVDPDSLNPDADPAFWLVPVHHLKTTMPKKINGAFQIRPSLNLICNQCCGT
jgi:hypothetical protein